MKLMTLNIWGGKIYDPLMQFLETHAKDIDVFCFQEVLFGTVAEFTPIDHARLNIFDEIGKRLSGFTAYTYLAPQDALHFQQELLPKETRPGQAIFVRNELTVTQDGGFRGYADNTPTGAENGGRITGSCQWVDIQLPEAKNVTVVNIHGLWQKGSNKIDTPERLDQSNIIKEFLAAKNGKKVLCGDFNLNPDGESIKILEDGMINLVKTSGATSTRSSFYTKPERFADYILVSPDLTVKHFAVLQDEVSDHLPLLLECE